MTETEGQSSTGRKVLFSCGVGNFCYDLYSKLMFSFGLIFYAKVANLSNEQAGLVLVCGQATNFAANFIFGYLCDHVDIPLLSRVHGRRKTWHLIGAILSVFFVVLAFTRCLLCPEPPLANSWLGFGNFAVAYGMGSFWMAAIEVAHLAIIPEVAKSHDEIVILNSIRAIFSYIGGICTYGVAWIFLGQSSDTYLSPDNSMDFTKIAAAISALGVIFMVIFHVGSPEKMVEMRAKEKTRRKSSAIISSGVYSVSVAYDMEQEGKKVTEGGNVGRKKSSVTTVLRKVSTYIVPFNAEMSQDDENPTVSNVTEGGNAGRKKSSVTTVLRKVSTYIVPFNAEMSQDDENPTVSNGSETSVTSQTERNFTLKNLEATDEITHPSEIAEENVQTAPRIRKGFVYEEPSHLAIADGQTFTTNPSSEDVEEFQEIQDNTKTQEGIEEDGRLASKSVTELLKDPLLYKVTAIFVSAYSLENLMFSYLALYLMDHLQFEKEATAYFSIVFLVSGICGSVICKILDKKIGRKNTYCATTVLAIITATWFCFVTESTKQMVYAPIVIFGCCVSSMIVIGLSYVGEFVGKNKESAGFVCSFASALQKATTGAMLMLIQSFYPSGSDVCQDCGNYVRIVYPLALGFLPLVGLLVVLFSEVLTLDCCDIEQDQPSEPTIVVNLPAEDASARSSAGTNDVTVWNTRL